MIRIRVPVTPQPYRAPRRSGKRMWSQNTAIIQEIRSHFAGLKPVLGAVRIHYEFGMPIPKSLSKKINTDNPVPHTKTPDLSNLVKLAEDAAKTYLFDDDCFVVGFSAHKQYSSDPYIYYEVNSVHHHNQFFQLPCETYTSVPC